LITKIGLCFIFLLFTFLEAKHPPDKTQEVVAPFLMDPQHPIRPILDKIFSYPDAILNLKTMEEAGFVRAKPRKFTQLIVTKHPEIPGYLFKLYLDAQSYHSEKPEHDYWILRIQGAEKIRQEIENNGLEGFFKVPHKWIYALPKPCRIEGYQTKYYVLVEEDMEIFDEEVNKNLWRSEQVTSVHLDHLYSIVRKLGLKDCLKPDNIPFSIDGRIAFIDTQTFGEEHIKFKKLNRFLSKSNQAYWKTLIK